MDAFVHRDVENRLRFAMVLVGEFAQFKLQRLVGRKEGNFRHTFIVQLGLVWSHIGNTRFLDSVRGLGRAVTPRALGGGRFQEA